MKIGDTKVCLVDPSHTTYIRKSGTPEWRKYRDGWLCKRCAGKLIDNPKKPKKLPNDYNDKRPWKSSRLDWESEQICMIDPTHETYVNGGKRWGRYKDGWLCLNCYKRLVSNPKRTKDYLKKYNDKRLLFKDKQIYLSDPPRKGKCSWCGNKVGDEYIDRFGKAAKTKRVSMHHIQYHDYNPSKDTVELCCSCHSKESARLRKMSRR